MALDHGAAGAVEPKIHRPGLRPGRKEVNFSVVPLHQHPLQSGAGNLPMTCLYPGTEILMLQGSPPTGMAIVMTPGKGLRTGIQNRIRINRLMFLHRA